MIIKHLASFVFFLFVTVGNYSFASESEDNLYKLELTSINDQINKIKNDFYSGNQNMVQEVKSIINLLENFQKELESFYDVHNEEVGRLEDAKETVTLVKVGQDEVIKEDSKKPIDKERLNAINLEGVPVSQIIGEIWALGDLTLEEKQYLHERVRSISFGEYQDVIDSLVDRGLDIQFDNMTGMPRYDDPLDGKADNDIVHTVQNELDKNSQLSIGWRTWYVFEFERRHKIVSVGINHHDPVTGGTLERPYTPVSGLLKMMTDVLNEENISYETIPNGNLEEHAFPILNESHIDLIVETGRNLFSKDIMIKYYLDEYVESARLRGVMTKNLAEAIKASFE